MRFFSMAMAVTFLLAGSVMAGVTPGIEPIIVGGDWTAGGMWAPPPADHIQTLMVSPGQYESTAVTDINTSGWAVQSTAISFVMDGPALTSSNLTWSEHYATDVAVAFTFHYQEYNGNTLLYDADITWNGTGWSTLENPGTWTDGRISSPLPEPATLAFLALGGAVAMVRRVRRKA